MAKKRKIDITEGNQVLDVSFEDVLHNSMIPYAESVILDRAIPRVEDGLKPVQRRVLYSMYEMGLTPDKPYKKCARIVGDCLGKYHPHGDSSVYDALVRLAQPFTMRMQLVDGHGNFGSVDGDGAAAMRYTEARMNPLTLELMRDIDKDTVDWLPNFDESLEEPMVIPGRFPNLLINGASGVAVGLATNIPPHNFGECIDAAVRYIEKPTVKTAELLEVLHGPDFPTGGYMILSDNLESIYETGRGKVMLMARLNVENDDNGKKNIVITELPYGVTKSKVLIDICTLKESGKFPALAGIYEVVDESDKSGMRGVIRCRRDAEVDKIIKILYDKTNLKISVNFNMVAIANGKPETLSLKAYLNYYTEFQRKVVLRRTNYDLKAAKLRVEIIDGLLVAIRNIDEVIRIIKTSETTQKAKETLRQRFDLSDVQAQAILDMRLKNLARLEVGKLEEERRELAAKIADLEDIIAHKTRQMSIVRKELLDLKKKYYSPRSTTVVTEMPKHESGGKNTETAQPIYRDGVITLNEEGYMHFMSKKTYAAAIKDTAALMHLPVQTLIVNNRGVLLAITNHGNAVRIDVTDLPEKKFKDKPFKLSALSDEVNDNEKIVKLFFYEGESSDELLLFTEKGIVKRTPVSEVSVKNKVVIKAINLADYDQVTAACLMSSGNVVIEVTASGQVIKYNASEVPSQGRNSSGVKGVKLSDNDSVIFAATTNDEGEIIVATDSGYLKRVIIPSFDATARYAKGVKLVELAGSSIRFLSVVTEPYDVYFMVNGKVETINSEDIRLDERTTKGKQVYKNGKIQAGAAIINFD